MRLMLDLEQSLSQAIGRCTFYAKALKTMLWIEEDRLMYSVDGNAHSRHRWVFSPISIGLVAYRETIGFSRFAADSDELVTLYDARTDVPVGLRKPVTSGGQFHSTAAMAA